MTPNELWSLLVFRSLVTTNDHLLKELEETKQRHMEEVKQLHWSYTQLRQTMDILPSSHTPRQTPSQAPRQSTAHTPTKAVNGYDTSPGGFPGQSPGRKVKGYSYSNGTMWGDRRHRLTLWTLKIDVGIVTKADSCPGIGFKNTKYLKVYKRW